MVFPDLIRFIGLTVSRFVAGVNTGNLFPHGSVGVWVLSVNRGPLTLTWVLPLRIKRKMHAPLGSC